MKGRSARAHFLDEPHHVMAVIVKDKGEAYVEALVVPSRNGGLAEALKRRLSEPGADFVGALGEDWNYGAELVDGELHYSVTTPKPEKD